MSEALKTSLDQIHEEFQATTEEGANKYGDLFEAALVSLLGPDKKKWKINFGLRPDFPAQFIGAGTNESLRSLFQSQFRTSVLMLKQAEEAGDETSVEDAKSAGGAMSFVLGFLAAKNLYENGGKNEQSNS